MRKEKTYTFNSSQLNWCPDCNKSGMRHCSNPEYCGENLGILIRPKDLHKYENQINSKEEE